MLWVDSMGAWPQSRASGWAGDKMVYSGEGQMGDQKTARGHSPANHCTLAVTEAVPARVNVQFLVLLPPLEHPPDQMASLPFVTLSVMEVPTAKDADPVLPTLTLMPAGLDDTRSPLRPVAVTVRVAA
jgi:hypothetical protein